MRTMEQATEGLSRPFRSLRHRDYRWYWISGVGQTAAQGMKQLVLAWLVLELTDSVGQLGLVVFMQGLPMALVAVFGGVLADRYDRRLLLILSQALTMGNLFILAALTISGDVTLWHVYVSSISLGATQSLSMPARQAIIRSLVPQADLMNAVALNAVLQHASRILWPPVAAGLIAWIGIGPTLVVNGMTLVVGIAALFPIRRLAAIATVQRRSPIRELADGIRYTWSTPVVSNVMTLAMAIGLFGLAFLNMAPGFAREELGFDVRATGLFVMASGVGSLLGSSVLIMWEASNKYRLFLVICVTFALSLIGLAVNPWYTAAFVLSGLFGLAATSLSVVGHTIFQTVVPSHLLGRVVSLWSFAGGLGSMTALPIGLMGEVYGLRVALGSVASILLAITVWVGIVMPARARRRRPTPAPTEPELTVDRRA